MPEYIGQPPACRPECTISSECSFDKACSNQKCIDPCPGTCGSNADCRVVNHSPLCSCRPGYTGDAFTRCLPIPSERNTIVNIIRMSINLPLLLAPAPVIVKDMYRDPCVPSPCGSNAQCRVLNQQASCSCITGFLGSPPFCRPECTINADCPSNLACINEKCRDPCPGSCGVAAICSVITHTPICSCPADYTGNPFQECVPKPVVQDPSNKTLLNFNFMGKFLKIFLILLQLYSKILVIPHPVVEMLFVTMASAHVCPNIRVIPILVADLNVS